MERWPAGRRRGRLGWGSLIVLMVAVLLVVQVGLTPWAVHMGGRSTPLETWEGYGPVTASNGGAYLLFVHLEGGLRSSGRHRGGGGMGRRDTLHGDARLCTRSGAVHTFRLTGRVEAWWTTDGAPTVVDLSGGAPSPLQAGWVVAFHGSWHGPSLELASPDNSFTEAFTPDGTIRRVTSTADAGTAQVTLQYGSASEFEAACRTLRHG